MIVQSTRFSSAQLKRFKELQQLSFSILESTAAQLAPGQTEKQVARQLVRRYRDHGFTSFFHLPVVLFGERTALPGKWTIGQFFPKRRELQEGDSVILDASPISEGYLVDTSYSFCIGENTRHRKMMADLQGFRERIRSAVDAGQHFKDIADEVAEDISDLGYEAVHSKHPGEVLGHRAVKLAKLPIQWRFRGFDALSLSWFGIKDKLAVAGVGRQSSLWNTRKSSDHAPQDGLWLVEPHLGHGDVGAKWEEILVIENGKARWLEDCPPHVRQWQRINNQQDYGPRTTT